MESDFDALFERACLKRGTVAPSEIKAARTLQLADGLPVPLAVRLIEQGTLSLAGACDVLAAPLCDVSGYDRQTLEVLGAWQFASVALRVLPDSSTGLLSALRTHAAASDRTRPRPRLDEILVRDGVLAEGQVQQVLSDPRFGGCRKVDKYRLLRLLGEGGFGRVWEAYDPVVRRICAIKLPGPGALFKPETLKRFLHEGQSLGRISHPGVVTVYEARQDESGTPFVVLERVDGASLRLLLENPKANGIPSALPDCADRHAFRTDFALEMTAQIAEATAAVHDAGVIHRDLKPENLIWIPELSRLKVIDFGLALDRDAETRDRTRSGVVAGTPAYMSPEQAAGRRDLDLRSDVYQIGAILYEMLTGRPAYGLEDAGNAWFRIQNHQEPPLPRTLDRHLDRDAETICLTAMAWDRERRYPSATALALDCRRRLAWRPIQARRPSMAYRMRRWVSRQPVLAGTGAAFLLALACASTLAVRHQRTMRDQERMETQFRAEALARSKLQARLLAELGEKTEIYLDATLQVRRAGGPLHSAEVIWRPNLRRAVEAVEREEPGLPEPLYYEGRVLRALGHGEEAERAQDEAIRRTGAPGMCRSKAAIAVWAMYERGVLRTARYVALLAERRLDLVRLRASGEGAAAPPPLLPRREEIETTWPELASLRTAAGKDLHFVVESGASIEGSRARALAARGMLAVISDGDAHESADLLERALGEDPSIEEAYTTRAQLDEIRGSWLDAAEWYQKGLRFDRGHIPHIVGLATALDQAASTIRERGGNGTPLLERALTHVDERLSMDPAQACVWQLRATLLVRRGNLKQDLGLDGSGFLREAVDAARRARTLDPRSAQAAAYEGDAWESIAGAEAAHGIDPTASLGKAIAGYDEAVELDPTLEVAEHNRSAAYVGLGEWKARHGLDPGEEIARAIQGYDRALKLNPRFLASAHNRAETLVFAGDWRADHGLDPTLVFVESVQWCSAMLSAAPRDTGLLSGQGLAYKSLGGWKRAHGQDPTEAYERAMSSYEAALSVNPRHQPSMKRRADLHAEIAEWKSEHGQDFSQQLVRALKCYRMAIEINPKDAGVQCNVATALTLLGTWLVDHGADPDEPCRHAIAAYEDAVGLNPSLAAAESGLSRAYGVLAKRNRLRSADPTEILQKAIQACERALQINPGDAFAENNRATALQELADWQSVHNVDPEASYAGAHDGYTRALAIDPGCASAALSRAMVSRSLGDRHRKSGRDPAEDYAKALADCRHALEVNAGDASARNNEGVVYSAMGDWRKDLGEDPSGEYEQALHCYARALGENPWLHEAALNQANTRISLAHWRIRQGGDPLEDYVQAIASATRVLSSNPKSGEAAKKCAEAYRDLAEWRRNRRLDPTDAYTCATRAYDCALELDSTNTDLLLSSGMVQCGLADWRRDRREDPSQNYAKAAASIARILAINPKHVLATHNLANLEIGRAHWRIRIGQDPTADIDRATEACERECAMDPDGADAVETRANLHHVKGDWMLHRREDPSAEYRKAISAHEAVLKVRPDDVHALFGLGLVHLALGEWLREKRSDAANCHASAAVAFERLLRLDPHCPMAAYNLGTAHKAEGDAKRDSGMDPISKYAAAAADFERELTLAPGLGNAAKELAWVRWQSGAWRRLQGQDPGPDYVDALAAFDRAVAAEPTLWTAHMLRGRLLEDVGRHAEAVAACEAAARIHGADDPDIQKLLARVSIKAAHPWTSTVTKAMLALDLGEYQTAARLLEDVVAEADRTPETASALRSARTRAHFDLARALAALSTGRSRRGDPSQPVDPDRAEHLRGAAIDHLRQAIRLDPAAASYIQTDALLEPLRSDARWMGSAQER